MEIGYNGLTEVESELIAESYERDITAGLLGTGLLWEIVHERTEKTGKQIIVDLLYQGYTSGHFPYWELKFTRRD